MKKRIYYFICKIKELLNIEEEKSIKIITPAKKYISREKAIEIADYEKNFRWHIYKEARDEGTFIGFIEIKRYYATLVKVKGNLAWFIKIIDAVIEDEDNDRNYVDEEMNISSLVMADTGEFIYLGNDYDTRDIHLVTNDEFLDYLMLIKK